MPDLPSVIIVPSFVHAYTVIMARSCGFSSRGEGRRARDVSGIAHTKIEAEGIKILLRSKEVKAVDGHIVNSHNHIEKEMSSD